MALFKRGKIWWIRITAPDGQRIRKSAGTENKEAAQEYHDRLKAELWRMAKLGERPDYRWKDAVVQWSREKDHKTSFSKDLEIFKWLDPFLRGVKLVDIDRRMLDRIAEAKRKESSKATANRYMGHIRAVLRRAANDWDWLDKVPKVPMYAGKVKRIRWLTREEAARLISHLPEHQAAMARFALATGLRQRNICRLEWSQVDMQRKVAWVHPDQAKAKKAIGVSLNSEAVEVLRKQIGKDQRFVFTYKGKPVWQVNTKAWRKAVEKAGLKDFRWHDLRHTWASWHAQAGTPLNILQEMGGWESPEMVQRYAHLSSEHLAPHAERIVQAGDGTKTAQPQLVAVK